MITNAQLKHLQSLKLKKYRQNYDEFIIEGDKLITEALLEDVHLKLICATNQWISLHQHAISSNIQVEEITEKQLEKISNLTTPPPVIAIAKMEMHSFDPKMVRKNWVIALDEINDPGNLGTIIRSADWFGIKIILCSANCVELYNPKVIQASMGSIFRVKLIYGDLQSLLLKSTVKKYAATLSGKKINHMKFEDEGILVIGSESHGIGEKILQLCDQEITIPKKGKAESLNAAVATSVILSKIING